MLGPGRGNGQPRHQGIQSSHLQGVCVWGGSVSVSWDVWTYWVEGYLFKVHLYLPQHIAFI